MNLPKNFLKLIISILLCEGAGILGSFFTFQSIPTWYATLIKPSFSPPNWIFGPVWTTLYFLMGVAVFLVVTSNRKQVTRNKALRIFAVQLVLNAIWSPVFFGLKNPALGLIVIIALLISIIFTIKEFLKVKKEAAILLAPYLAWVSFATYLNYQLWILNK